MSSLWRSRGSRRRTNGHPDSDQSPCRIARPSRRGAAYDVRRVPSTPRRNVARAAGLRGFRRLARREARQQRAHTFGETTAPTSSRILTAQNTSKSLRAIYVPVDFMPPPGEVAGHATVFRTYSGGLDKQRWWIAPNPAARREIPNESGDLSRLPHGTQSALSERRQVHSPSTTHGLADGCRELSSSNERVIYAAKQSVARRARQHLSLGSHRQHGVGAENTR